LGKEVAMLDKRERLLVSLLTAGVLVALSAGGASALPNYIGTLSTPGDIVGTGYWTTTGPTQIAWSAAQMADGSWRYIYVLDVPGATLERLLVEVSSDFTTDDVRNVSGDFTSYDLVTLTPPDGSNPNLPGPIHALQFDGAATNSAAVMFDSPRAPAWGDFYAQNGTTFNPPGVINSAWNAGFTLPDPTVPPADGPLDQHILVPDSSTLVPDASTAMLASIGIVPVLAAMRRRRK
jgi:hypothetical protein